MTNEEMLKIALSKDLDSYDNLNLLIEVLKVCDDKNIKIKILSKLSMLDFYLEKSFKNNITSYFIFSVHNILWFYILYICFISN